MKFINSIALVFTAVVVISCQSKSENQTSTTPDDATGAGGTAQPEQAVCIWDKISLRSEPSGDAKWITQISLGEELMFLGETSIDSTSKSPRSYSKVRLTDGTEGWSLSDFILPGAKAGAFISATVVYNRPDLLTKSDKEFASMDIVGAIGEQDDWTEVNGRISGTEYLSKGWVKTSSLTFNTIDIAVAKFAQAAMSEKDEAKKMAAIQEILNNPDLQSSVFIEQLRALVAPEEIMDEPIEIVEEALDSADTVESDVL